MKRDSSKLIKEYAGNPYWVDVNPRVQKFGQSTGWEGVDFRTPGVKSATRGDCVIRALALATGLSYINVARKLRVKLDDKNDVPGIFNGYRWGDVFKFFNKTYRVSDQKLFMAFMRNKVHANSLTVKEFARTISRHADFKDKYLIVGCRSNSGPYLQSGHVVFVKNGRYYDTWDSGDWLVFDVFDATDERRPTAYDFRNIVQIRRGTKKRYYTNREPPVEVSPAEPDSAEIDSVEAHSTEINPAETGEVAESDARRRNMRLNEKEHYWGDQPEFEVGQWLEIATYDYTKPGNPPKEPRIGRVEGIRRNRYDPYDHGNPLADPRDGMIYYEIDIPERNEVISLPADWSMKAIGEDDERVAAAKAKVASRKEPPWIGSIYESSPRKIMKTQINIKLLTRLLKEDIQREHALETARGMFLTECRKLLILEAEARTNNSPLKVFDHVSKEEQREVWARLHKKYWPDADPNGPILGIDGRKGQRVAAKFMQEYNKELSEIHVKNGGKLAPEHVAYAKDMAALVNDTKKSWMDDFVDGIRQTIDEKFNIIVKYAKTAGIAALILGAVFAVIYGVKQAISMIATMRKSKRESRDAAAVTMKLPFKSDEQVQKFCETVRNKKMSKYVEIESIDGTTVEVTCDQDYIRKHINEIQAAIKEIKSEKNQNQAKIAAESVSGKMTFAQLKELIK